MCSLLLLSYICVKCMFICSLLMLLYTYVVCFCYCIPACSLLLLSMPCVVCYCCCIPVCNLLILLYTCVQFRISVVYLSVVCQYSYTCVQFVIAVVYLCEVANLKPPVVSYIGVRFRSVFPQVYLVPPGLDGYRPIWLSPGHILPDSRRTQRCSRLQNHVYSNFCLKNLNDVQILNYLAIYSDRTD